MSPAPPTDEDPRDLRRATRATYAVFAAAGGAFAAWAGRIPAVKTELGLTPGQLGLLLLAGSAGSLVGLPLAGRVASAIGVARTVLLGAALTLAGLVALGPVIERTGSPAWTGAALFVALFGIGQWDVAMNLHGADVDRRGGTNLMPRFHAAFSLGTVASALAAAALASLLVWSVAWRWSFPDAWPESWSLGAWMRPAAGWGPAVVETARTGVVATLLSLALAIAWLESEDRAGLGRARWAEALIYLPLIVPQIAFLFGLSIALLGVGLPAGAPAVIWGHALFVFPYVMIALSESWRALDPRLVRSAAALGAGPWRRLVAVKLPVLSRPILTAAAIGFAVSVAQYLPTLFLGAGRVATLTTEAVTLASGSDRRITGVYAVLQAALPFAAYLLALLLPAAMRRRRGLAAS